MAKGSRGGKRAVGDKKINDIAQEIEQKKKKLAEISKNNPTWDLPEEYYKTQRERQSLEKQYRGLLEKQRKTKINSKEYKAEQKKVRKERAMKEKQEKKNAESIARAQAGSRQGRKEKKMYERMVNGLYGEDPRK